MAADGIRVLQLTDGGHLQRTDKLYAVRGSGVGADFQVTIPLEATTSNTILGYSILASGIPGAVTENALFGTNIMDVSTTGRGNSLFGYKCGQANNGDYNTGMGVFTLQANITGYENTALGASALSFALGSGNIGVGVAAGGNLVTGDNNIFIGNNTYSPTSTSSDYLNIGGALTGTVGGTKSLNSVGNFSVATNKFTVASATGNTLIAGTLGVTGAISAAFYGAVSATTGAFSSTLACTGNFAVNTNKFSVAATTGNTLVAGTLGVTGAVSGASYSGGTVSGTTGSFSSTLACTGNFAVNTNKFTVASSTGNTLVAGTLGVTGAISGASYSGGAVSGTTGSFSSTLACTGNFSVATNQFTVEAATGNTNIDGTLTASGDFNINGGYFRATSTGNTTVGGTLGIAGVTTTTDNIFLDAVASASKLFRIRYGGTIYYYFSETIASLRPAYTNTTAGSANVVVSSDGELRRSTSSRKFKENERPLEMNTSKIDEVAFCTFNMKDSGQLGHGPISEDIALVEPNFATYDLEGEPEAIHTNNLLYALIVEHQKLKQTVSTLEQRLAKLEAK